jgi:hypothetical protein
LDCFIQFVQLEQVKILMLNKKNVGGINDLHQLIIPDQKFDVKTKARMPPSPDLPNLIMRNFYLKDFESFFSL